MIFKWSLNFMFFQVFWSSFQAGTHLFTGTKTVSLCHLQMISYAYVCKCVSLIVFKLKISPECLIKEIAYWCFSYYWVKQYHLVYKYEVNISYNLNDWKSLWNFLLFALCL